MWIDERLIRKWCTLDRFVSCFQRKRQDVSSGPLLRATDWLSPAHTALYGGMARLEDVSDDESSAVASSTVSSRSRLPCPQVTYGQQRASGTRADLRSRIPLAHPSALPKPTKAPLLSDIPIPDNLTRTRIVDQHGNELSPEDLAELEDDEDEDGAGQEDEVEVIEEEEEDEFFTTLLMAVPFSFLYLLMDM